MNRTALLTASNICKKSNYPEFPNYHIFVKFFSMFPLFGLSSFILCIFLFFSPHQFAPCGEPRRGGLFAASESEFPFLHDFRAKIQFFLHMCNFFCIFVAKKMIYGYIRVSSDKQTVENQRFEIERFCKVNNLHIDGWIEETISGTKAYNKRQLGVLLKKVEKEDVIICSELSRLGRSLFMIMEILSICMKKECRVWTIKDNYRLGDDIQSKVLAFAFGLSAEIERNLISQRTKEALARKRAEGVQLGRPKGKQSRQCTYKLHKKEELISGLLAEGVSFKKVGDILHVNKDTVRKYYHTFMEN